MRIFLKTHIRGFHCCNITGLIPAADLFNSLWTAALIQTAAITSGCSLRFSLMFGFFWSLKQSSESLNTTRTKTSGLKRRSDKKDPAGFGSDIADVRSEAVGWNQDRGVSWIFESNVTLWRSERRWRETLLVWSARRQCDRSETRDPHVWARETNSDPDLSEIRLKETRHSPTTRCPPPPPPRSPPPPWTSARPGYQLNSCRWPSPSESSASTHTYLHYCYI